MRKEESQGGSDGSGQYGRPERADDVKATPDVRIGAVMIIADERCDGMELSHAEVIEWIAGQGIADLSRPIGAFPMATELDFCFPLAVGADPLRTAIAGSLRFDPFIVAVHFGSRFVGANCGRIIQDDEGSDSDAWAGRLYWQECPTEA